MQAFKTEFATDGTDWDFVPYDMYLYGGGGIGGWASLCGIPNGCVALLNLIGLHGTLGAEVMGHYSSTTWPTSQLPDLYYAAGGHGPYGPDYYTWVKQPIDDSEVLAHVISYSPLCHISISKWCYAAGVSLGDMGPHSYQHKNDRCGKICSDMAAFTAELINYYALNFARHWEPEPEPGHWVIDDDGIEAPYQLPAETAACSTCHKPSGLDASVYPAQTGKMDCWECHTDQMPHMARDMFIDDIWMTDYGSDVPETQFQPNQLVSYHVRFAYLGAGAVWMKTRFSKGYGKDTSDNYWKNTLSRDEEMMGSIKTWTFNKTIPADAKTNSWCKYYMRIQMFDHEGVSTPITEDTKQIKFKIVP